MPDHRSHILPIRIRAAAVAAAVLAVAVAPLGAVEGAAAATAGAPRLDAPGRRAGFPMPLDSGPRLLAQRAQAQADLAAWTPALDDAHGDLAVIDDRRRALEQRLGEMSVTARRAADELEAARERLERVAADAYVHAGPSRVSATVDVLLDARDVLDLRRDLELLDHYGSQETAAAKHYREKWEAADGEVRRLTDLRTRILRDDADARRRVDEAGAAIADAQRRLDDAIAGIARFHAVAVDADSPIRGPIRLTADDLAAYVRASGHEPRLTVPLEQLAQIYLEEGADEVVRGDVAWVQSILETGWFKFPDGGLVDWTDNNFAGIGACDSCAHGFLFPDARTGVRAQIQALRIYVDPHVGPEDLANPSILRGGIFRLGFRGDVQSWNDLTGRWATAQHYGERIYQLYNDMVAFARSRRA